MKTGYYKVSFMAALPGAPGVIIIDKKNTLRGGDDQYLYHGTIEKKGEIVTATVKVIAYVNHAQNVFDNARSAYSLDLTGSFADGQIQLSGPNPMNLGAEISINCQFICDLDLE